jgi:hypothetical protein
MKKDVERRGAKKPATLRDGWISSGIGCWLWLRMKIGTDVCGQCGCLNHNIQLLWILLCVWICPMMGWIAFNEAGYQFGTVKVARKEVEKLRGSWGSLQRDWLEDCEYHTGYSGKYSCHWAVSKAGVVNWATSNKGSWTDR